MAVHKVETYTCDRCGKEILDYDYRKHRVCDGINAYFYDLCDECREVYDRYEIYAQSLLDQIDALTRDKKFGKYMKEGEEYGRESSN